MKQLPNIAGALLGFVFVAVGLMVLLGVGPEPPAPPEGSPAAMFMAAMVPTGYMAMVKVLEVVGGLLVAYPRTRNLGLLVLGPIVVNILAYHLFVMGGEGLFGPQVILVTVLAAYLVWAERAAFGQLVARDRAEEA